MEMTRAVWFAVLAAWLVLEGSCQPKVVVDTASRPCTLARLHVEGHNQEQGNWSVRLGDMQGVISHHSEKNIPQSSEPGVWEAAVYYGLQGCGSIEGSGKPEARRTYVFHSKPSTFESAVEACKSKGADLTFPKSENEAKALKEIFSRHHNISDRDVIENQARIGAFSPKGDGNFVTVNGEGVKLNGYLRWAEEQPDNYLQEENCLAIIRDGLLNDVPCWLELPFICEK